MTGDFLPRRKNSQCPYKQHQRRSTEEKDKYLSEKSLIQMPAQTDAYALSDRTGSNARECQGEQPQVIETCECLYHHGPNSRKNIKHTHISARPVWVPSPEQYIDAERCPYHGYGRTDKAAYYAHHHPQK